MAEYIVRTPKDKNDVRAVLGDAVSSTFVPRFKLSKWDGEVEFTVAHDFTGMVGGRTFSRVGEVYTLDNSRVALKFYPKPDAYEFELILKRKPATNIISLPITTKGLVYYYQPPLTEEYRVGDAISGGKVGSVTETEVRDDRGNIVCHRSKNVVGSYAVYHATKRNDYTLRGGMNYGCGKAFHIYRPKLTDALGVESWATLQVSTQTGRLIITAPQAFLDTATYPVIVDPTFGKTDVGASGDAGDSNYIIGYEAALSETGTPTSLHVASRDNSQNVQLAIYDDTVTTRNRKAYTGTGTTIANTFVSIDVTAADELSAGNYFLCGNTYSYCYDSGTCDGGYVSQAYGTWPATISNTNNYINKLFSIYCTYSVGAAATNVVMNIL